MTQWFVYGVCASARGWQNPGGPPVRVTVPFFQSQFLHAPVVESVDRALRDSGLEPGCLDLALDEGIFLLDPERTFNTLRALLDFGLTLSIANFGSGYAPLGDLTAVAIRTLRIDSDLVSKITVDQERGAIVRGIIAMAHELSIQVIAEGVQDEAQAAWLHAHHCDMIQGALVGGPLTSEAFRQMAPGAGGPQCAAA
jgi:EAL domain-containing protein (putative c-di-GMP-specific phosphodiesterase class I)